MRSLFPTPPPPPRRGWKCLQVNMYGAAIAAPKSLAEQTREQRDQLGADEDDTAARHQLFHPQLGVKALLDGGRRRTKNLYGVVKRTVPAGQVRQ